MDLRLHYGISLEKSPLRSLADDDDEDSNCYKILIIQDTNERNEQITGEKLNDQVSSHKNI